MEIGQKLLTLRKNRDISVYRLSKLTDISENYIHQVEKGKKNPSVLVLDKLLSGLGITLAEFFNENNDAFYLTSLESEFINSIRLMSMEKATALLQIAKYMNDSNKTT